MLLAHTNYGVSSILDGQGVGELGSYIFRRDSSYVSKTGQHIQHADDFATTIQYRDMLSDRDEQFIEDTEKRRESEELIAEVCQHTRKITERPHLETA